MQSNPYEVDLEKNPANFQPLTPITFLERTASVEPQHIAIIHGRRAVTYGEFWARCKKLASALSQRRIGVGDTVSVMLSNTPPMLEAHFGIPMTGAVLHCINTRLDAAIVAFQLDHANTRVLITDKEFSRTIKEALMLCRVTPLIIDYDDLEFPQTGDRLGVYEYEEFLARGDVNFEWQRPADEWAAIALNYTSGTTGNPKGVVYHHRGAALMCYANTIETGMQRHPVYLWTLPMFHCNGWCFPWSLSVVAGTHICIRWVRAKAIYDAIADYGVTHLSGAPIVMATLLNAMEDERRPIRHRVSFNHAAAPPPQAVLDQMVAAGFQLTHLYGLTETYGPATVNTWHDSWNALAPDERAAKRIRQGVGYVALDGLTVMDPSSMQRVPADGETLGEVMFRGNIVMKGYLKNKAASDEAFEGGWFHSGDLGVLHPDGYIQLKDRSKDVIISGGENISSIEVEDVLYKHPDVAYCAVVAKPDDRWGETPCAFIELKNESGASVEDFKQWCRQRLAHYKCPRHIVFAEIPKTSTGKIQKFKLREMAKEAS